jgi:transcriptional regulator with XRE-family HTH domain
MPSTRFGERLRYLRRVAGKNLADLADAAGLSITYVSAIERGAKSPPDRHAIEIWSNLLNCQEELPSLLMLAAKEKSSIELQVKGKPENVVNMFNALARSADSDQITAEAAEAIQKILDKLLSKGDK